MPKLLATPPVDPEKAAPINILARGAHRPSSDPVPWRARAIGAAISLFLVGATVGVLLAVGGHQADRDVSFNQTDRKSPPGPTIPSPSALRSVEPSPVPSPAPPPVTHSPAPVPVTRPALTVLNNSTIKTLGAQAAARFRAAGWPVAAIDGITGRYGYTTVYYGPGQLEAARELVRQFPGIQVIDSRANVPELPGTGLTVVVTKDFG
ncbi:MAG: LytR C-terminal domain-containing protein [Actinomycetota bacterium]|nr:LytR C-terminal domain-containing protein [Actinomycetota bacterium]